MIFDLPLITYVGTKVVKLFSSNLQFGNMNYEQVAKSDEFKERIRKIAKWWKVLNELYGRNELDRKALRKQTGLSNPDLSKALSELEESGLVFIRREKNPRGGHPLLFVRLSEYGERIVGAIIMPTEPKEESVKLKEADPILISFLIKKIQEPSSLEVKEHAMEDFKELCYHRTIIRHKEARDLIKELIQTEDGLRWGVGCLVRMLDYSKKVNDQEALEIFKKEFFRILEDIANKPMEKNFILRLEAMAMMQRFLSLDEWFEKFKGIIEKSVKEEEDKTYNSFYEEIMSLLNNFVKGKERETWEWLYSLLEDKNEIVKKRSDKLLKVLRFESIL